MTAYFYLQLLAYTTGTVTVVPLWYLLFTGTLLHKNFRTILFLATIAGQGVAFPMYTYAIYKELAPDPDTVFTSLLFDVAVIFTKMFEMGCLFLCIERAVAVAKLGTYEQYVSPVITVVITVTLIAVSLLIAVGVQFIHRNNLYIGYALAVYALSSFIITIAIWIYRRKSHRFGKMNSLQKKFQHRENGRTFPIYFCVSANELIFSGISLVMYVLMTKAVNEMDAYTAFELFDALQLVDAYRIAFVNVVVLVNWYLYRRTRRPVVQSQPQDEAKTYFDQLHQSWNPIVETKSGRKM
ncbi:hypothetical protein Y032_0006g2961 [Ancylostoma ceylanicum]|nr:hypothetical protein Y032_0006g2961 [Ancylostoma ceylanicum]